MLARERQGESEGGSATDKIISKQKETMLHETLCYIFCSGKLACNTVAATG